MIVMTLGIPLLLVLLLVLAVRFALPARSRIRKGVQKWWWPLVGFKSPYGHRLPNRMRVMADGEVLADSDRDVALVSRHSLLGSGIICPECRHQAALPGEWDKVVSSSLGEGVFCICNRMLVAAPDDDIDPVNPGEPYDEKLYHTFARPPQWKKPGQRTLKRDPVEGDRVLVSEWTDSTLGLIKTGEGIVLLIVGKVATIKLIRGPSSQVVIDVPFSALAVLDQPVLLIKDRVEINRGIQKGLVGTIKAIKDGEVTLAFSEDASLDVDVPIEHISKVTA